MVVHQGVLYAGTGDTVGDGDVWRYNGGTSWTQIGGDGLNTGWAGATIERVQSLVSDGTNLYAGLALTAGDAEVWRWNGTTWSQIGGDAVNASWANATYEYVYSMTNDGTDIYVGLGLSSGDGEVWRWDGATWAKIGGDAVNSGFGGTSGSINSLTYDASSSTLYAGVQSTYGAHEWSYNGSSWSLIGGNSIDGSWSNYYLGTVTSLTSHNGKQYVGTGASQSTALVYEYDGSSYTLVGGSGYKNSWPHGNNGVYEAVHSLFSFNGDLYAGIGSNGGDGEVWRYNGSTWSQVGGDGVNGSWSTASYVNTMVASYTPLFLVEVLMGISMNIMVRRG